MNKPKQSGLERFGVIDNMQMLGSRRDGDEGGGHTGGVAASSVPTANEFDDLDGEIPF
ncbi:MAG: hypothetical protein ACYDG3_06765 [Bacillati bacterium]